MRYRDKYTGAYKFLTIWEALDGSGFQVSKLLKYLCRPSSVKINYLGRPTYLVPDRLLSIKSKVDTYPFGLFRTIIPLTKYTNIIRSSSSAQHISFIPPTTLYKYSVWSANSDNLCYATVSVALVVNWPSSKTRVAPPIQIISNDGDTDRLMSMSCCNTNTTQLIHIATIVSYMLLFTHNVGGVCSRLVVAYHRDRSKDLGSSNIFCYVMLCYVMLCYVLLCSVLFCSVLFCSVLFCSVLFCSVLFYSILFYSIIF